MILGREHAWTARWIVFLMGSRGITPADGVPGVVLAAAVAARKSTPMTIEEWRRLSEDAWDTAGDVLTAGPREPVDRAP